MRQPTAESDTSETSGKEAEEKIEVYQERLRLLASQLILTLERERRHFATELQDSIGQLLAVCKIKLGELGKALASSNSQQVLGEIGDLLKEIIQHTRSLSLRLGPPVLYELGLEAALGWLVEYVQEQHRIQTNLELDGLAKPVGEELRVFLFRAVEELLVNVVKHAETDRVEVSVSRGNKSIRISVQDAGVGFDTAILDTPSGKNGGFGLFSIREHIRYFGGALSLYSKPGQGTQVTLAVPIKTLQGKDKRREH